MHTCWWSQSYTLVYMQAASHWPPIDHYTCQQHSVQHKHNKVCCKASRLIGVKRERYWQGKYRWGWVDWCDAFINVYHDIKITWGKNRYCTTVHQHGNMHQVLLTGDRCLTVATVSTAPVLVCNVQYITYVRIYSRNVERCCTKDKKFVYEIHRQPKLLLSEYWKYWQSF